MTLIGELINAVHVTSDVTESCCPWQYHARHLCWLLVTSIAGANIMHRTSYTVGTQKLIAYGM